MATTVIVKGFGKSAVWWKLLKEVKDAKKRSKHDTRNDVKSKGKSGR